MLHVMYLEKGVTVAASDRKQIRKVICENMSRASSRNFIHQVRSSCRTLGSYGINDFQRDREVEGTPSM